MTDSLRRTPAEPCGGGPDVSSSAVQRTIRVIVKSWENESGRLGAITKPGLESQDGRLLDLCARIGATSPDPRTKIGCIIIAPDGSIRSAACNTFPEGVSNAPAERSQPPLKYLWFEHAERNAIYYAARGGVATNGCTMVSELLPCIDCARAIIQAGIKFVVISRTRAASYRGLVYTAGEYDTAMGMLAEADVLVRFAGASDA